MADGKVAICAAGLKGAVFASGLLGFGVGIGRIVSYHQPDDASHSFERLQHLADEAGAAFEANKRPQIAHDILTFIVGWQFLLDDTGPNAVVFHDSLLPRYRGFAPTVTSLINGEAQIGVTALAPAAGMDEGPILARQAVEIRYPIKIARALELQSRAMVDLAVVIHDRWKRGDLSAVEQDHSKATYSMWRDASDYVIDWSRSADQIARFIDAVGYPYAGARTADGKDIVIVHDATVVGDLAYELREPGKVSRLEDGRPIVICGAGLLRLDRCTNVDGSTHEFKKLRLRLAPADDPMEA